MVEHNINDLVQDCSNSSALALELLQSCSKHAKPSIYQTLQKNIIHFGAFLSEPFDVCC